MKDKKTHGYPPFHMENANSLYVAVINLLEETLANHGIKLSEDQDDEIYAVLTTILEDVSTGYYANHN